MSEGVRLYAGTQHGLIVWRSAANGWQEVARHFADGIIDSIHGCKQSSETVFVGVTHDGLYRTVDGGQSWAKVFEGDIRSVTVDPNDDRVVYTGIEPVGLFRSEDGGDSWQEIAALKALPQSVRKNWWYPQAPHHGHVRNIHIYADDPKTIYLCLEHGGIVRSFDRGQTWEDVSKASTISIFTSSRIFPNVPIATTSHRRGFFTSDKPEDGWVRAENGTDTRLLPRLPVLAGAAGRRTTDDAAGDRRCFPWFLATRKPRRQRGDVQKHRRGAIVDAHHRRARRRSRLDDLGLGSSSDGSARRFCRLRQRRPRPRIRRRRRRRSNDQPRHGRQLAATRY